MAQKVEQAKTRYWVGILYPENMREDWEQQIGDILELPYAYCRHDRDVDSNGEIAKEHIHIIIVFPNTTTYKHALSVFDKLSADKKKAINTCEPITNIRHKYNYLIHDTETAKKDGKYLYPTTDRICGNNFDIAHYEQLSTLEKNDMCKELCTIIREQGFLTFGEFFDYVVVEKDNSYFELIKTYSGLFERLTKSNYYSYLQRQRDLQG